MRWEQNTSCLFNKKPEYKTWNDKLCFMFPFVLFRFSVREHTFIFIYFYIVCVLSVFFLIFIMQNCRNFHELNYHQIFVLCFCVFFMPFWNKRKIWTHKFDYLKAFKGCFDEDLMRTKFMAILWWLFWCTKIHAPISIQKKTFIFFSPNDA